MTAQKKYLREIWFKELLLWDVKRIFVAKIQSKYPIVSLLEVICERSEKIKLFDFPEQEFGILGVNNKEGIFDAYSEKGEKINQPYKKMYVDDLAYNPYRVNVGSVGLRTKEHQNNFISPAYVVFTPNQKKLLPDFLYKIFQTATFNRIINENTTGSVRQNLTYEILKNLQIPLPETTEEQQKILDKYQQKIYEAQNAETTAKELEKNIEEFLLLELGMEKPKTAEKQKGLQEVRFRDLERWDATFLLGKLATYKTIFPIKKVKNVIQYFLNDGKKTLRFNSFQFPQEKFSYIGMEHIEKESGILLDFPVLNGAEIKSQTVLLPPHFFLYGKLRPYLNKYFFNRTDETFICSSEFFAFSINKSESLNDFFEIIISSEIVQSQIKDKFSGARMPRINEETFKEIKIPLPPLEIQQKIVEKISGIKAEIKNLKELAQQNRENAILEFEREIFLG